MKKLLVILSLVLWPLSGAIAQDSRTVAVPGGNAKLALGIQGVAGGVPIPVSGGGVVGGSTEAKQDDQITELQAILAKILAAPSTEAKQDDLNALIVIIDAVLDTIKLDTANISSDQATETTLAALNALIVIIDATLDAIKLDTANISSDQATATLQIAIDAVLDQIKLDTVNLTSDPSTATLQSSLNALIAIIDATLDAIKLDTANLTSDPATATLQIAIDAVLDQIKLDTANLTSDPATATLQSTLNALIVTIDAVLDLILVDTGNIDTNTSSIPVGAPSQDHKAVVVGASATLILAADTDRRFAIVCNADNTLVAIGNSDVTLNTAVATDGKALNPSGTADADDGTGGCFSFETTAAIYGIGADAGSKVTIFWGTN